LLGSAAFEAFSCYELDDGSSAYLQADVSVECSAPYAGHVVHDAHLHITRVAWMTIGVYPFGLFALNAVLLFRARVAIRTGVETPLSRATAFLHSELEPYFFWWELIEMVRRVVLVGVFVLVKRGSLTQLLTAIFFCASYLMVQTQAWPYLDVVE
jgi:hypothetical protein